MEVMNLGSVVLDMAEGEYVGSVSISIGNDENPSDHAIDLTVFAYRDSGWRPSYFKFAGLAQVVKCSKPSVGRPTPRYLTSADIYFNVILGDDEEQNFPLDPKPLPSFYADADREKLFQLLNRSFYFSINSHDE